MKSKSITWILRTVKIADLKNFSKNPRKIKSQSQEDLKISIGKFGLIDKPVMNQDYTLIGGHQRVAIHAQEAIEVWYPSRLLNKKEVEELNIRLNKNSGEWDLNLLLHNFDKSDLFSWGFKEEDFGHFLKDFSEHNQEMDPETFGDEMIMKFKFSKVDYIMVKAALQKYGQSVKKVTPEESLKHLIKKHANV